jgi:DNA-binding CsgD family transcriptional regulator
LGRKLVATVGRKRGKIAPMEGAVRATQAEVRQLLAEGDLSRAISLLRQLVADSGAPEDRLLLGRLAFVATDLAEATAQMERAYHDFMLQGLRREAARAAVDLGRAYIDGLENQQVGQAWLNRAIRILEREDLCVERGYAALALVGCSVDSADDLDANAQLALDLAHRFGDVALECKALGEWGLALVSKGRVSEGMARIDESFAMIVSGECRDPMVTAHVECSMLSACERCGDATRAETWLRLLEERTPQPDASPAIHTFAHCWSAYGSVLCQMGRWSEAETALRLGIARGERSFMHTRLTTRAALADLWIRQGRLDEAAALIDPNVDRAELMGPRARLYLAQGQFDLAVAVARQALRLLRGDRLRSASLLLLVVDAELGRDNFGAANDGADRLEELARDGEIPSLAAQAGLAQGRVASARGDVQAASRHFESGLAALAGGGWPLLRASLHVSLARVLQAGSPAQAAVEAQSALSIYERVGAPEATVAAGVLAAMGIAVTLAPRQPGPLEQLSKREREVLVLVAQGLSNPEIAQRLFITAKTAEHHVSSILGKLGLRSRAEAAAFAASVRVSA